MSNPVVISLVIEQHAEEAAFLWLLRDDAVYAPHYSLEDLAELDNRVEAHLDGLRIAGAGGWEICKDQLAWQDTGEVFAASVLALESGSEERFDTVLEAASESVEQARGFISALGWLPYGQAHQYIERLLAAESAALRRMGLAATAIHRQDVGQYLSDAITDSDPLLRARALKAVGELGRRDLYNLLSPSLQDEDPACRFYAAWSAALLGDDAVERVLCPIAEEGGLYAEKACDIAMRRMRLSEAHRWQQQLTRRPECCRIAVIGAGVIGDAALIPWLIEMMEIPELARVAGDAFTMITGVDLADEDLEREFADEDLDSESSEEFEAGPTEDPEDEDVEMDADDDLTWPDPKLVAEWWQTHQAEFRDGTRYLLGKPISLEWLQEVLRTGFQRQRAAAALELAMSQPGQPLFEVRAPGFRQKQMLGVK